MTIQVFLGEEYISGGEQSDTSRSHSPFVVRVWAWGGSGDGERWVDLEHVLEAELSGYTDELDMRSQKRKGSLFLDFGLINRQMAVMVIRLFIVYSSKLTFLYSTL
jgi:hypothetical protein